MRDNGRTPILVGCGQIKQRVDDPRDGQEPVALMLEALRRAGEDCGAPAILSSAESIRVPQGLWPYSDPAALLRDALGATSARTASSVISGNMVQYMISDAAQEIAAGRMEVALVAGGEAEHSKRRAKARDLTLPWTEQQNATPDVRFGKEERDMVRREIDVGLVQPALIFALYENAMRHARGETIDQHRDRISQLWSGFNEVAQSNPFAWSTERLSPEEIRTPSASNRMHAFPYTKFMCSNMVVDQAAAVIVCSVEAARRFGIDPDRWVYLHAATDAQRSAPLSNRGDFLKTDLIRHAGERAFALAKTSPDEMTYVDLYSCFPAAVQLGLAELQLPADTTPTVTGGLGFAGGPFNSYVLHAIATMMNRLREDRRAKGLVSSVGGWVSKQAVGIYSAEPPAEGFRHANLDPEIESGALPVGRRELDEDYAGAATVETYAVRYKDGEPVAAAVACLNAEGNRAWAKTTDAELIDSMTREELCGREVAIQEDGTLAA